MTAAVKSAARTLAVFELLAEHETLTFSDIADRLELPRSSAHQLLATLVAEDYLHFDPARRTYGLGLGLWRVAQACRPIEDIRSLCRGAMEQLRDATTETVQLAQLEGRHAVYLAIAESAHPVKLVSKPGARLPAHSSAIGKAMLAHLDEADARRRLEREPLESFTEHTVTDVDRLLAEFARIRRRGHATDSEEFSRGLRCLAMPVHGRSGSVVAAVSVAMPAPRYSAAVGAQALESLRAATAEIDRSLASEGGEL